MAALRFFADDKYASVADALLTEGLVSVSEPDAADLVWTNLRSLDLDQCHQHLWVNHLKGAQHFSNKAYLVYHLLTAKRVDPQHFPATWSPAVHDAALLLAMLTSGELQSENCNPLCSQVRRLLPAGHADWADQQQRALSENVWIVKPVGLSCGRDISVCQGMQATLETVRALQHKCVVQRYITRPLLVRDGRKFDIRQWVLVASLEPLVVYGFSDCYVRMTSKRFSLDAATLTDPLMHLCNHAVQKLALGEGVSEDITETETMLSQASFAEELSRLTGRADCYRAEVLPQIRAIAVDTVLSVRDALSNPYRNGFEWLGFDLMVQEDLSVQLIEVNTSPDLTLSTSVTAPIVRAALGDTFALLLKEFSATRGLSAGGDGRASAAPRSGVPTDEEEEKTDPRWQCWLAESVDEARGGSPWAAASAKRRVATLQKNYALRDGHLIDGALQVLQGLAATAAPPAPGDDDDEF